MLRNLLVVGQVALSLIVLASAGLFVHSLRQMQNLAFGFRPDGLLMMSMDLGLQQYSDERSRQFLETLVARAEALPGVTSATIGVHVPLDYGIQINDVSIDGEIPGTKDNHLSVAYNVVGPRFLETTGGTAAAGAARSTGPTARRRGASALVNETMATKLWPGKDACRSALPRRRRNDDWIEVVGIVANGKYVMLGEEPRPYYYLPLAQEHRRAAR